MCRLSPWAVAIEWARPLGLVIVGPIIVGLVSLVASLPTADACGLDDPFRAEIHAEDTPDCLAVTDSLGPTINAANRCDEDVEFEAIACDGPCDTNIVIPAGEDAEILLEARSHTIFERGEFVRQRYGWTSGAQSGEVATAVSHRDRGQGARCAEDAPMGCTHAREGAPPASVILIVAALAALALRRDMLANQHHEPRAQSRQR